MLSYGTSVQLDDQEKTAWLVSPVADDLTVIFIVSQMTLRTKQDLMAPNKKGFVPYLSGASDLSVKFTFSLTVS